MKVILATLVVTLSVLLAYQDNKIAELEKQNKEIKQLKIDNSELEMYYDEVVLQLRWCEESLEN